MNITLGQIAGLIAALAFFALVIALIRPLGKLGGVLDRLADAVTELTEHTLPALDEAAKSIREANGQLERVDTITSAAARTAEDVSAMTTLVTSTIAAPFVALRNAASKVKSAFRRKSSHGEEEL
ncbi:MULTISPECIES: DUF948 domain-containing protein [unclassified Actinobaculum]|uniref:DUF948 domain-containing protein n=1 Tax=unclassified Actinobaculum TaxID=2609299 RepID=UPI000D529F9D|nr:MULTISPECIES: DUF948 domain-containing protein [unclassified Actinobaculum]AWE42365.1 DUF948 domain-containing protein [Actinobaculum sp. 313]RTE50945.1 DUF948 domain-containing protein [Actinobaculum sp. 352]